MFIQAKELRENDMFDMEPLLHYFQDNGLLTSDQGGPMDQEDVNELFDQASFEYAVVEEIEWEGADCILLSTSQGAWGVLPEQLIDYQGAV